MTALPIVQVRMLSTRLPGKALATIGRKSALEHVIARVREAGIGDPVVATTWDPEDDRVDQLCAQLSVACYRGHPTDVLARFTDAAKHYGAHDGIVRVTADCPFLDPGLLKLVADRLEHGREHYVGVKGAPDGLHGEAFTLKALECANFAAQDPADREHVVPYMIRNYPCGWVQANIEGPPLTLDTADDLERLRRLAA